jgi:hypothetical protein
LLPAVPFRDRRIIACRSACKRLLPGAGDSQRPFTRPQRLPVSGPPLRGRCSRPAASKPYQTAKRDRSADSYRALAGLHPAQAGSWLPARIPSRGPALRGRATDLHSPSGAFAPSGSKRSTRPVPGSPPSESARWPFAPRRSPVLISCRCGSSFQTRYVSGGPLFLAFLNQHLNELLTALSFVAEPCN